jgi:hypothetical protein
LLPALQLQSLSLVLRQAFQQVSLLALLLELLALLGAEASPPNER